MLKRILLTAKYKGEAGDHGYKTDEHYHLELTQKWFGQKLHMIPIKGLYNKEVKNLSRGHYRNLGEFLAHWDIVALEGVVGYFGD